METENYREIDLSAFAGIEIDRPVSEFGKLPEMTWLRVDRLVIDSTYQREIGRRGAGNVIGIARAFDWNKFGVIIVARLEDGRYAIVDGQHRTAAAHLLGIMMVPCQVIEADRLAQAAAFADINSKVTAMSPLQIHAARVAHSDADALELNAVCARAGVEICRYPVPANKMEVGQTLAVTALGRLLKTYGSDVLELALKCITRSGDGNRGMVRANIVRSICQVLHAEPPFRRNEKKLVAAFDSFDFDECFDEAHSERRKRHLSFDLVFTRYVFEHLDAHLVGAAA